MLEVNADLMTYTSDDQFLPVWKILPTNYTVDSKGLAIMGAGLAKQFADAYPTARYELGILIQCNPTVPRVLPLGIRSGAFWWALPTKHSPFEAKSSLEFIANHVWELHLYYQRQVVKPIVVMPKLGCGCGGLKWVSVKTVIEKDFARYGDNVVICNTEVCDVK
jgi:hypothetical protein